MFLADRDAIRYYLLADERTYGIVYDHYVIRGCDILYTEDAVRDRLHTVVPTRYDADDLIQSIGRLDILDFIFPSRYTYDDDPIDLIMVLEYLSSVC